MLRFYAFRRFYNVGFDGSLCDDGDFLFLGYFAQGLVEFVPEGLSFLLSIRLTLEHLEKLLLGIDVLGFDTQFLERVHHKFGFALPTQPVVYKDRKQQVSDGFVHQICGDGAIHATAARGNHAAFAYGFSDFFQRIFDELFCVKHLASLTKLPEHSFALCPF
jgi:hypothetical protein